jgi:pimeloyl-ACP methyl ester carboxylesterase
VCHKLGIYPQAIVGHSFGGKVALLAAKHIEGLLSVWLLECSLGPVANRNPLKGEESVSALDIIEILESMPGPINSRRAFMEYLQGKGVGRSIAAWMTTNLVSDHQGMYLNFEPSELRHMLLDFLSLDLWPQISSLSQWVKIHLVAAEYGGRLGPNDEEKIKTETKRGRGFFHLLPASGHFVHVDNLNGLVDILDVHLK